MRGLRTSLPYLCAAVAVCSAPTRAQASPIYEIVNLGPGRATGINSAGEVAGWRVNHDGTTAAVVFSPGGSVRHAGAGTLAGAINSSGTLAGTAYTAGGERAFLWNGGSIELMTLAGGPSWALAMNASGSVAGAATVASGEVHAFLYSDGRVQDLGTLGGTWSSAYALNNAGQAAGASLTAAGMFHAFLWDPTAGLRDLGTLGGASSYAFGLNDLGQVVGHSQVASGFFRAFVWDKDTGLRDLGTLGGSASFGAAINNAGHVVGYSWVAGSEATHAFLYREGVLLDLNALVEGAEGWTLMEAVGINDAGQIAGTGLLNGIEYAYRLDPIHGGSFELPEIHNPEPNTLILALAGLILVIYGKPAGAGSSRR